MHGHLNDKELLRVSVIYPDHLQGATSLVDVYSIYVIQLVGAIYVHQTGVYKMYIKYMYLFCIWQKICINNMLLHVISLLKLNVSR